MRSSEKREREVIEFDILSGDDIVIGPVIENYNKTYNTNFEIVRFIYDEVVLAKIRVSRYEPTDLFSLGYQFGTTIQYRKNNNELNW